MKKYFLIFKLTKICVIIEMTLQIHVEWIRIQKWSAIIGCKLFYEDMLGSHRAVVRSIFFQNKIR